MDDLRRQVIGGQEMVSATFVIPYPPGFPILVPGQVISTRDSRVHAPRST